MSERQDHEYPHKPHGNGQHDQEGIGERTKLRYQDEIQQHKREQEAQPETFEGGFHAFHHAAQRDSHVRRIRGMVQDFSNRVRDLTQVLSGRRHVDVGDSLNLVVVHFRRRLNKT